MEGFKLNAFLNLKSELPSLFISQRKLFNELEIGKGWAVN